MSQNLSTRVGYVLCNDLSGRNPSTRISALNMFPYLRQNGFEPVILYAPELFFTSPERDKEIETSNILGKALDNGVDIAYFERVYGHAARKIASELSRHGIKTIFGVCDIVDIEMAKTCDLTIAVSANLKSLYGEDIQHRIRLNHDGIEKPESFKQSYSTHYATNDMPLEAIIITTRQVEVLPYLNSLPDFVHLTIVGGYGYNNSFASRVRKAIKKLVANPSPDLAMHYARRALEIAMNKKKGIYEKLKNGATFEKIPWYYDTVFDHLNRSDIGILPVDFDKDWLGFPYNIWNTKSNNRLTQMMAAGLPVIASPVPSYLPIVKHGINSFIAYSLEEWNMFFEQLREPDRREEIGRKARESVLQDFSQDEQAKKLIEVLRELRREPQNELTCLAS